MPDGRPTPEQLADLGLDESDLATLGTEDTGDLGSIDDQEPVIDGHAAPASEPPASPKTPPAPQPPAAATAETPAPTALEPSPGSTPAPQPPAPAGTPAPAAAPTAPAPQPTTESPWTPTADGRRLEIAGATVDPEGNVRIPADAVPLLSRHLADRNAWRDRERRYQDEIAARDPAKHEDVILSKLLVDQLAQAMAQGEEALWEYVQGFKAALPVLTERAKGEALKHENERLKSRVEPIERETAQRELEPILQESFAQHLDAALQTPDFQGLGSERDRLLQRLWGMRDRLVETAREDMPQIGVQRGQPVIRLDVIRQELQWLKELRADQQAEASRRAAATRNAATLTPAAPVPPAVPVGGAPLPADADGSLGPAPTNRKEWLDRMNRIGSS